MHTHWTEYKITSIRPSVRPSVRPASVDKIVTLFLDRSSPNLEHSFPVSYRRFFKQLDPTWYTRMRDHYRLSLAACTNY